MRAGRSPSCKETAVLGAAGGLFSPQTPEPGGVASWTYPGEQAWIVQTSNVRQVLFYRIERFRAKEQPQASLKISKLIFRLPCGCSLCALHTARPASPDCPEAAGCTSISRLLKLHMLCQTQMKQVKKELPSRAVILSVYGREGSPPGTQRKTTREILRLSLRYAP